MRLLRNSIISLIFIIFTASVLPSCGTGGSTKYRFTKYQTHRKHYSRGHKKYYKNRTARHSRPVSKDYIIKNKRRNRGW
jgi:hypothetical protein